jgi:hypothetical protein
MPIIMSPIPHVYRFCLFTSIYYRNKFVNYVGRQALVNMVKFPLERVKRDSATQVLKEFRMASNREPTL